MGVEYGVFLIDGGSRVAVYDSVTEVGEFFAHVPEENRPRYVVRERTLTVGPWVDYPATAPVTPDANMVNAITEAVDTYSLDVTTNPKILRAMEDVYRTGQMDGAASAHVEIHARVAGDCCDGES